MVHKMPTYQVLVVGWP